jgi:hypothetical protein
MRPGATAGAENLGGMQVDSDAAQQHWMETMAAQGTLIGLSDCPGQFREPAMSALFRQAWRERFGHRDGMDYLKVPF